MALNTLLRVPASHRSMCTWFLDAPQHDTQQDKKSRSSRGQAPVKNTDVRYQRQIAVFHICTWCDLWMTYQFNCSLLSYVSLLSAITKWQVTSDSSLSIRRVFFFVCFFSLLCEGVFFVYLHYSVFHFYLLGVSLALFYLLGVSLALS